MVAHARDEGHLRARSSLLRKPECVERDDVVHVLGHVQVGLRVVAVAAALAIRAREEYRSLVHCVVAVKRAEPASIADGRAEDALTEACVKEARALESYLMLVVAQPLRWM